VTGEGDWMPNGGGRNQQWAAIFSTAAAVLSLDQTASYGSSAALVDMNTMPMAGMPASRCLGLYLGSHDPLARIQAFNAVGRYPNASSTAAGKEAISAGWRWLHLPDNLLDGSAGRWVLPYPVVLQSTGDWWDASQIHREWAVSSAVWTAGGNLADRATSVPAWFVRTALWVEGASIGSAVLHWTKVLQDALGLADLGVFWPFWNMQEFDTCYPEFSPLPNFAESVASMQASGIHAVPYTNGRLFDVTSKVGNDTKGQPWKCDSARADWLANNNSALAGACGRNACTTCNPFWAESYNHRTFAVMNPSTNYWQSRVAANAKMLGQHYGTAGVYIDQVTSTFPQLCATDGVVVAGAGWANGTRALLRRAAIAAGGSQSKLVISESNAEAYVGSAAGSMALYGYMQCGWVPAFQAVYSGYTVLVNSVGWNVSSDGQDADIAAARTLLAHQWTDGLVLGGDGLGYSSAAHYFSNSSHLADARYLATLATQRVAHIKYFVYGRLMRQPVLRNTSVGDGKLCTYWGPSKTCCVVSRPSLQLWQQADAQMLALVAANADMFALSFAATVDMAGVPNAAPGMTIAVRQITASARTQPGGNASAVVVHEWSTQVVSMPWTGGAAVTVTDIVMPPLSALVIEFGPISSFASNY
jgi:hypothetical protein